MSEQREHLISAPPGYWFLMLTYPNERGGYRGPISLVESIVIAWRIKDDRVMNPVTYDPLPKGNHWDSALEIPDGRCLDDGGYIYPDRAAWLNQSIASYEETRAEEAEMVEKR